MKLCTYIYAKTSCNSYAGCVANALLRTTAAHEDFYYHYLHGYCKQKSDSVQCARYATVFVSGATCALFCTCSVPPFDEQVTQNGFGLSFTHPAQHIRDYYLTKIIH